MTGYRDARPWDVLNKPARHQPSDRGFITQDTLLFALRSLGRADPMRVAAELGVADHKYTARNLGSMFRGGQLARAKKLVSTSGQHRSTFEYWIKETTQ